MSRFELKIVGALLLIAVFPLVSSIVLVGQIIKVSNSVAVGQVAWLAQPLERAADAYRGFFQARKDTFRLQGQALAADPQLQTALSENQPSQLISVLDEFLTNHPELGEITLQQTNGKIIAKRERLAKFPADSFREYAKIFPLVDKNYQLSLKFFTSLTPFDDFRRLGQAQLTDEQLQKLRGELTSYYRVAFLIIFSGVLLVATGLGLFIARRTTRRVAKLAAATKEVTAGNLDIQVDFTVNDEIGFLGHSFNEMVRNIKETRERIAYLERIGAWQQIARRLAHEIKNPLTPIQLAIQQLQSKYDGRDPQFSKLLNDSTEIITEEVAGLRRLVEDFSAFAKLPKVNPEPVDLHQLLDDFSRNHPEFADKLNLRWELPEQKYQILVDRMLIKNVLFNLIENAIQAAENTKRGDKLTVTIGAKVRANIRQVLLSVRDNGPGMDRETRDHAFDPYFTTKEQGTGLGLAIVKKIILEHEGSISLSSTVGEGTCITLTLPLAEKSAG